MTDYPLGAELPEAVLARRAELPRKPAPVTLSGEVVTLTPLDLARDSEALHAVSNGQPVDLGDRAVGAYDPATLIWRYLAGGPFPDAAALAAYLSAQVEAPDGLPFCVRLVSNGHPVGVANYMSNAPEHLKIELGNIWYGPVAQRAGANTEATYLLLRHAFELGYRRLEWKCNALNARSRRAAERMGFTFEGVQEAHYIVRDRTRDTAWYRILDHEWPAVRAHLEGLLGAHRA